jgi:GNAT superfamily N-acetyltransferase
VVCSILAPAIGSRHADNPHFVGAVSRGWQTRDRACSTPDGTQLAADQVGRWFTLLVGARAIAWTSPSRSQVRACFGAPDQLRSMHRIREAVAEDRCFLVEMARLACTLEDRPLPEPDAAEVLACLPPAMSAAVIATNDDERPLAAAWWHLHEPPLVMTTEGSPMPELTMAVVEGARGHGIGTALIEAGQQRRNAFRCNRFERPPSPPGSPPLHAQRFSSRRQRPRMVRPSGDPRAARLNVQSARTIRPYGRVY